MSDGINWGIQSAHPATDAVNSVVGGMKYGRQMRDQRAMEEAGAALSGGDYSGAANVLFNRGMLQPGLDLQAQQQKQQAAQKEETHKYILNSAEAVRYNLKTPDERRAYYQGVIRPELEARGLAATRDGQLMLSRFDASTWADQDLDLFISTYGGEIRRPEYQIVSPGGGEVIAVDKLNPSGEGIVPIRQRPEQPKGEWRSEGGNLWFFPADGSPPVKGDALTPAPKVFAPRRPSGGGGGGPAASSGPAPWERDW